MVRDCAKPAVPSRWHWPQMKGTFIGATADRGSFTGYDVVVPVTIHTAGRQRIAARNRLPVERPGMLLLLGRVARAALYRRRLLVRKILSFQVGVAARAPEAAMDGSGKFLPVHVQRNRFAGSRCAHALVAVAGETFRSGLVGGAGGACRKQQGENRGDERRNDNSQTSTALASHISCFSHVLFQPCRNFLGSVSSNASAVLRGTRLVPPGLKSFFHFSQR